MATNPKIPPRRDFPPDDHAHVVIGEKRSTWWPPVLIIAALAVIGALIWWLSQSPNRKPAPTSVAGQGVQLTKLSATTPTVGGSFEILGTLVNTGQNPIMGIRVEAAFKNIHGQNVETIPGNVEPAEAVKPPAGAPAGSEVGGQPSGTHGFVKPGGGEGNLTKGTNQSNPPMTPAFATNPIQPGQSVPIAIPFTHVPAGWVGGVPNLRITSVETTQQSSNGTK